MEGVNSSPIQFFPRARHFPLPHSPSFHQFSHKIPSPSSWPFPLPSLSLFHKCSIQILFYKGMKHQIGPLAKQRQQKGAIRNANKKCGQKNNLLHRLFLTKYPPKCPAKRRRRMGRIIVPMGKGVVFPTFPPHPLLLIPSIQMSSIPSFHFLRIPLPLPFHFPFCFARKYFCFGQPRQGEGGGYFRNLTGQPMRWWAPHTASLFVAPSSPHSPPGAPKKTNCLSPPSSLFQLIQMVHVIFAFLPFFFPLPPPIPIGNFIEFCCSPLLRQFPSKNPPFPPPPPSPSPIYICCCAHLPFFPIPSPPFLLSTKGSTSSLGGKK